MDELENREVLMHRSHKRRFSRSVIGVTAVVLFLGAAFTIHNLKGSKAQQASANKPRPAAVAPPTTAPAVPSPKADTPFATAGLVTRTPSVAATVAPVALTQAAPAAAPNTPAAQPAATDTQAPPPADPAVSLSSPQASAALQQGEAKLKAGDPLEARRLLNEALQSGKLDAADQANAKATISHISQKVVFSPQRFDDDPYGGTFTVPPGGVLAKIAQHYTVPWEFLANLNNITPRSLRAGQTIKIIKGPFHAVVNKSAFTIDIYLHALPGKEGSMYVTTLPVGLGRDNSTPTGLWDVGGKLKNPKFWGLADMKPVEGGAPDNPLGKYWIALTGLDGHAVGKTSYGIHGTNDPNSVGTMASHGCIRLRDADIALVYSLLSSSKSTVLVVK
jgi:lipoprotein-anchoring transpeptidase ErfK/SrfK